MTKGVYLDNAATTWPKAPGVAQAIANFLEQGSANPGRGGHSLSLAAGRMVFECRAKLACMFGVKDDSRIVFANNATHALNMALFGFLSTGDHCITTSMEHNGVSRPLHFLQSRGVDVTVVQCDSLGRLDEDSLRAAIRPRTKLLAMTHASNVCGTLLPVAEACAIAKSQGIATLVDAAQTAGVLDIDVERMGIDMLAAPGHKSLLGPTGTGVLYVDSRLKVEPMLYGGTGSFSELLDMPEVYPDRLESGTLNTVGIAGLSASLDYLSLRGIKSVREHEQALAKRAIDGLSAIPRVKLYGASPRAPIVAFNIDDVGSTEVAHMLDASFGIATRAGLHCAPWAHLTLGTVEQGVVRVSPGPFSTEDDIDLLLTAVQEIVQEMTEC